MRNLILIGLLLLSACAETVRQDELVIGRSASTAAKKITFDTGDGASNPSLSVADSGGSATWNKSLAVSGTTTLTGAATMTGGVSGNLTATGIVRGSGGLTTNGTDVVLMKVITGTGDATGNFTTSHGLTASKILAILCQDYYSGTGLYTHYYNTASYNYGARWNSSQLTCYNDSHANSAFTALIFYKP